MIDRDNDPFAQHLPKDFTVDENEKVCRQAYQDVYHKVRAEMTYGQFKSVWDMCVERAHMLASPLLPQQGGEQTDLIQGLIYSLRSLSQRMKDANYSVEAEDVDTAISFIDAAVLPQGGEVKAVVRNERQEHDEWFYRYVESIGLISNASSLHTWSAWQARAAISAPVAQALPVVAEKPKSVRLPKLPKELYEFYPSMSAQSNEKAVR